MEYDERLSVPVRWWVLGTLLAFSLWVALLVALPPTAAWVLAGVLAVLLVACLSALGSARVQVEGDVLRAGRAHIELRHLGAITPLDATAARLQAGREADARAYLLLRPYLKRAVRVDVADPADPAPYWLIGTRHPERLAQAVSAARVAAER